MSDSQMRRLTITAAEWASREDGTLWLVRAADVGQGGLFYPPVEFVAVCSPCETCAGSRCVVPPNCDCDRVTSLNYALCTHPPADCPDCLIELVGCADCVAWPTVGCPTFHTGTVTFGHAYAVGQPLPIVRDRCRGADHLSVKMMQPHMNGGGHYSMAIYRKNALGGYSMTPEFGQKAQQSVAHYGQPESLVGKWALHVAVGS